MNSYQLTLILDGVGTRRDRGKFSVHSPFIEVYVSHYYDAYVNRTP